MSRRMVKRLFFVVCFIGFFGNASAQVGRSLSYYIESAENNSPLLKDYINQKRLSAYEKQRLKEWYTRSRWELNGSYLIVPTVSTNNGKTDLQLDALDGNNYYGYDLGQTNSNIQAGVTYKKPLLGNMAYKVAEQQLNIDRQISDNNSKLTIHDLEKMVTEQYLLCLLDKEQIDYVDSVDILLKRLSNMIFRLVHQGYMNITDYQLSKIEIEHNHGVILASQQSYESHIKDLNVLCGVDDTTSVSLNKMFIPMKFVSPIKSSFLNKYELDSLNVDANLHSFELQYKPQLDLYVDGGINSIRFCDVPRRFGISAGITFTWLLPDKKQKKLMKEESVLKLNSIACYKQNFMFQSKKQREGCLKELKKMEERSRNIQRQLDDYDLLLVNYDKQLGKGNVSIVNYIMTLKDRISLKKDLMTLQTNKLILINTYNYWNW